MTLMEFIQIELKTDGFSDQQILDFLNDGAALAELAKKIDFTQSDVEQAHIAVLYWGVKASGFRIGEKL
jgi:hypothetical protein